MALTYGLYTPCDLFEKLIVEKERLQQNFNSHNFFNFVVTAYHLCDWVEKAFSLKKEDIKKRLGDDYTIIEICRDIANASKHFGIDRYPPIVSHADSVAGYGIGRYGYGEYGSGEERITITLKTGEEFDGYDFVNRVVEIWEEILKDYC